MNEEIVSSVVKCVCKVLAVPPEEVTGASRLTVDLGADSLDLVELMFELEQELGVRLENEDLSLTAQLGIPEASLHHDEVLTPEALSLLRERFPGNAELLHEGARRKELAALLTVDEVARAMERKLSPQRAAGG